MSILTSKCPCVGGSKGVLGGGRRAPERGGQSLQSGAKCPRYRHTSAKEARSYLFYTVCFRDLFEEWKLS